MYFKTKLLNLSNYLDPEKKINQVQRKRKDACIILRDAVTPLTTQIIYDIKMAANDTPIGFRYLARLSLAVNDLK